MNKKVISALIIVILILMLGIVIFIINNSKKNNQNNENVINEKNNIQLDLQENEQIDETVIEKEQNNIMKNENVENIKIKVNNEVLDVKLEHNSATEALIERLKQGDIIVNASEYGSFEKVGSLGFNLPTNDTQITTKVGDVMLYQGNQITIFYGKNSWKYTKLGEVIGDTKNKLKDILGSGDTTLVLSIN